MRKRDTIDRDLISLLSETARMSTSEIARRLGLARSTVNERIARLEQDGIILGYQAVVAPEADLIETRSFLHIRSDRSQGRQIVQALRGFPEIQECASVSGAFNLICTVRTPCAEDIDALIEDMMAIEGVEDITATVVLADKFGRAPLRTPESGGHLSLAS